MASTTYDIDPVSGYPVPKKTKGRYKRNCSLEFVTKNEPLESPALLSIIDGNNVTEAAELWRKLSESRVLRRDEFIPVTHPARFHLFRSEKGVEKTIVSKEPAMPVVVTQKRNHIVYEWKIRDERGIHNKLLSEVNEFTLQSPNGRLLMYDPITDQSKVGVVVLTLMGRTREMRDVDDFKTSVTYGGIALGKHGFVYVTFERFLDEDVPPLRPAKSSTTDGKKGGKDEEDEEEEEEESSETSYDEQKDDEFGELSEVLRSRTLATISVVVRSKHQE